MQKKIASLTIAIITILFTFSCSHANSNNLNSVTDQQSVTIDTPMIISPVEIIYQFPIYRFMSPSIIADSGYTNLPFGHPKNVLKPMYLIENSDDDDKLTVSMPFAIALIDSIHTIPIHRLIPLPSNADSVLVPIPYDPSKFKQKKLFNMQALYVTGYQTKGATFNNFLTQAKEAGFDSIVFDVKEMQGHVYFSIQNHPNLKYTYSEPILDVNTVVKKIHDHGFYATARIVQFYNRETARRHPELQPKNRNGGYWTEREGAHAWLDSSHPEVQDELLRIIEIVAKSNVDEIQLDYVRFPTEGAISRAIFYFETEDEAQLKVDPNYKKREKRDIIRDYLKRVRAVCDRHNVKLAADVFAIVAWQRSPDIRNTGQDIAYMSPYLHKIHPMLYSSHFSDDFIFEKPNFIKKPYHIVRAGIEKSIAKADPKCQVIPYLQAFSWRVDYNREYMFQQLNAAKDSGAKGYILWNASGNYTNGIGWVKDWNLLQRK